MVAYTIMNGEVHDAEQYDRYKTLASAAVAKFGGRFLVRGGEMKIYEGNPMARTVVVEFPDMQTAQAFYESPEYAAALVYAKTSATRNYWIVQGG